MVKRTEQLAAGDLSATVRFERRAAIDDSYGNERADWVPQFSRRAYIAHTKGGEDVMAARLQGRSPAIVVVRYDPSTKTITPDWRAIEIRGDGSEVAYAIRQAQDMERERRWMTLLCETGVADTESLGAS